MSILIITTGGTIGALPYLDPVHPPDYSSMPEDTDLVRDFLTKKINQNGLRYLSMPPKDSKLIDDAYRATLCSHIANAHERNVLITHGTDTILKTADYLYGAVKDKILILTGAMTPLANGPLSDGYQNIGLAVKELAGNRLANGIYLVLSEHSGPDQIWQAQLYPYTPGRYQKLYVEDGRYNRLVLNDAPTNSN